MNKNPRRVSPNRIIPANQSRPGHQIGNALYWVRVDPKDQSRNEHELIIENGQALFFYDVDASWAFAESYPTHREGWAVTCQTAGYNS